MGFFGHFEIDIISALREQLLASFDGLHPQGLTAENLLLTPTSQGVYHLHRNGILVYVGKADNLRNRLSQHQFKIMGRQNIDVAEMTFACVTIHPNWTALAPESALIQHYAELHLSEWNGIGFGPHDPGRNRETTDADQEGFDMQFPIRHEWPCEFVEAREWNIRELLIRMKEELPFLLRYECINKKYRAGHADYNDRTVVVPQGGIGASELIGTGNPAYTWMAVHSVPRSHDSLPREQTVCPWHGDPPAARLRLPFPLPPVEGLHFRVRTPVYP